MKKYTINNDQLNAIILSITGWNGFYDKLIIVKKSNFAYEKYNTNCDLWEYEGSEEYEHLKNICKSDEMIVLDVVEASLEEKLKYVSKEISNYPVDENDTFLDNKLFDLYNLEEILLQNNCKITLKNQKHI